jgi:hypothetical protein
MSFLGLLILATLGCQNEQRELQEMEMVLDSLSGIVETQQRQNDSLEQINLNTNETVIPVYFKKEFDTIDDPRAYITDALQKQREKIPIDAVLGGSMEFRQVEILTEDWVMAVYDDGHIQGKSIYEYELQPNGDIQFTEVVSKLPKDE